MAAEGERERVEAWLGDPARNRLSLQKAAAPKDTAPSSLWLSGAVLDELVAENERPVLVELCLARRTLGSLAPAMQSFVSSGSPAASCVQLLERLTKSLEESRPRDEDLNAGWSADGAGEAWDAAAGDDGSWAESGEGAGWDTMQEAESALLSKNRAKAALAKDEDVKESTALARQRSYEVIRTDRLREMQRRLITSTAVKFGITVSAAGTLLRVCRWSEAEFERRFRDPAAQKKLCSDAGVTHSLHAVLDPPPENAGPKDTFRCQVCFDDVNVTSESFALPCKHRFCIACFKQHLASAVEGGVAGGANCLHAKCPGFKCSESIGEEIFEMLLEPELFAKYSRALFQSFVDDNDSVTWCPRPDCPNVVAYSSRKSTVECRCGQLFCFSCKQAPHAPCTCDEAKQWAVRDKQDNLDLLYIINNTKPCPYCRVPTKKDGGCMYITCSQCKKPWCWHCGKGDHHVWECDRQVYDTAGALKNDNEQQRYLTTYMRYFNHKESHKVAVRMLADVEAKMQKRETSKHELQLLEFVRDARKTIVRCRWILMWTYAKSFFLKKEQMHLFEFKQRSLEEYTERLNVLTELDASDLERSRLQVLDYTKAIQQYLLGVEESA